MDALSLSLSNCTADERYRLRMINITDDMVDLRVRLTSNDKPVQWKIVAKDGADLPAAQLKFSRGRHADYGGGNL